MPKTVGIDLGTTNSVVAVMEGGQPKVISSAEGSTRIPSVVDVEKNIVGEVAKRQLVVAPKTTVYSVKRLMGRKVTDPEVQNAKQFLSYEIASGQNDAAVVKINDKTYTPQEISAKILSKLKQDAENYLGETVTAAVITVPAYFNDSQRQATKQAGEIAGLEVTRIINEPTAAALAYGLERKGNETIAVYDLGGGTFDISVLEVGDGVFEVKSTNGDTHLGGDDFDQRIINYLAEQFQKESGIDLKQDRQALQRLKDAAEKAKIELSAKQDTEVSIPFITADQTGPKHLQLTLTRATLENLIDDLVTRTFKAVDQAITDSGVDKAQINEVILVGGQTRMPYIQKKVQEYFGKEPHQGVNPDEVVAIGAAIQAGVLGGEIQDVVLLDVTPLTLGIETLGGVMTPIIERNTTIPATESQIFSTAADNQTSVEIHIVQGERSVAAQNKSLGRFILSGIPPAQRGLPQIEVTFDIDANGILNVSAKDKATGTEQKITIQNTTELSQEEVERMKREAEMHAEEDRKYKEKAEVRNQAESLMYSVEKTLKEHGDTVPAEVKDEINSKVEEVKTALQGDDIAVLKQKIDTLSEAVQKVGAAMYQQPQEQPPTPDQTDDNTNDGSTIDGTATDKEDK